jgi:hypothetical protein
MNRRAALVIGLTVMVTLTLAGGARAWTVAAQNHRRFQEGEIRQSQLYQQLANREAVLESQRRRYIEQVRRLEAEVRGREQDIAVLRTRLATPMTPVR